MPSDGGSREPEGLAEAVLSGDRAALGRAITLVESTRPDHQAAAQALLAELLPATGASQRVAITGVPGAGKSSLIEILGLRLAEAGHRVAVLAIDPSSALSGGSILGDKTRMQGLAAHPRAFIRPSPSAGTLGGVARRTREAMLLCEAAGHDLIFVETVGVGQSEAAAAEIVDFVLLLLVAGAGDELQGIKRGVLELAELVAVTKADGDNRERARQAARRYRSALRLLPPRDPAWRPPVMAISAETGEGLDELWDAVERHRALTEASGARAARREAQRVGWMWRALEDGLRQRLRAHPAVAARLSALEAEVRAGRLPPTAAAEALLDAALGAQPPSSSEAAKPSG